MNNPQRGDIWWVNFNPTIGAEIQKIRTAVVVSLDSIGKLPLRIVVPITGWDDRYATHPWMVNIPKNVMNGLNKESAADCFQIKSVSLERFTQKIGCVDGNILEEISTAIQICIGAI